VSGSRPLNFSQIVRQTKNMKGPELFISAGTYKGYCSALAYPIMEDVATAVCAGHEKPGYMEIGELEDDPKTLTATPSLTPNDATVEAKFDPTNKVVVIDMYPIMVARQILAPKETNIHIPIARRPGEQDGGRFVLGGGAGVEPSLAC
jgi:hypothetical protein